MGQVYKGVGRRGAGVGWVVEKLKQRSTMTQIVEFRVAMMCIYTHKEPILHYKA